MGKANGRKDGSRDYPTLNPNPNPKPNPLGRYVASSDSMVNSPTKTQSPNRSRSSLMFTPPQASVGLSRTLSGKTADDVWKNIEQGEKMKSSEVVKREPSTGEMTLEDFLTKAGVMDEESSMSPIMQFDVPGTPQCFSQQMGLLSAPLIGGLSDTPVVGMKREIGDPMDRSIEKKMRRKIKNRESAARSRARKQAYHNELVSKVSRLEDLNIRLKKEKELQDLCLSNLSQPRYQLRRTTSSTF